MMAQSQKNDREFLGYVLTAGQRDHLHAVSM